MTVNVSRSLGEMDIILILSSKWACVYMTKLEAVDEFSARQEFLGTRIFDIGVKNSSSVIVCEYDCIVYVLCNIWCE